MKVMICPECKQVISEGEYSGKNYCGTCWKRSLSRDRSDLIEQEDGRTEEPQKRTYDDGVSRSQNSSKDLVQKRPTRKISLDSIRLVSGASWEENYSGARTLLIKPIFIDYFISLAPLLFLMLPFGVGIINPDPTGKHEDIALFCLALPVIIIVCLIFCKHYIVRVWIEIHEGSFVIEKGYFSRNGNTKVLARKAGTNVYFEKYGFGRSATYRVFISDADDRVEVRKGLDRQRASEFVDMLMNLRDASM